MKNIITTKNIKELKEYKFRIPLYQREYAWGKDEVEQLINDLETFQERKINKKYFLGNIVVDRIDENYYDVIDGQQRLTTLYLLMILLENEVYELNYEIREEDDKFLKDLKNLKILKNISIEKLKKTYKDINPNFIINIEVMKNKTITQDLLNDVIVTITEIPKEMDIIKYFEVMNNRGKQLEKHQILKAKFLQQLQNDNSKDWAKIWDYCSYINSPIEDLIYYNLSEEGKNKNKVEEIRKNLLNFNYENYFKGESKEERKKIKELLEEKDAKSENETKSQYEYRSILKFPIFLIHVLKIFIVLNSLEDKNGFKKLNDIKVNDKDLLDYFYENKSHSNFLFNASLAKNFLELMLKLRILFDYFVIKRDKNDEPFIFRNDNYHLKMIELLFINSAPQYFAQHWIGIFLKWLYENKNNIIKIDNKVNFDNQGTINFLEEFDNELAKVRLSEKEIADFIDEKMKDLNNKQVDINKNLEDILNKGTSTPHYWFYKLDYLLWRDYNWKELNNKFEESKNFKYLKIKEQYRLTRLHSIEHIYPQIKKDNWKCEECNECPNKENCIDCFGNLALISNHLNSALLDKDYKNKRLKIQEQLNNGTIESIKMLLIYSKYQEWNEGNCKDHYDEMIKILEEFLN